MENEKHIGLFTGGGIAPGLNAVIHGAVNVIQASGNVALGIQDGWKGMIQPKSPISFRDMHWSRERINNLLRKGGTALGSSRTKITEADHEQVRRVAADVYNLDGVIAIGGDDTLRQAAELDSKGILRVVGVPKTIDNDVNGTERTFGFETAYHYAAREIADMRTDAKSMKRVAAVEIMGRDAGWITLYAGYIGGADITLIPEFPIPHDELMERVQVLYALQGYAVLAVAEGYNALNGEVDPFGNAKKEDAAKNLTKMIREKTKIPTQVHIPSYSVRNKAPIASDAEFASRLGATAGLLAVEGNYGNMVALQGNDIVAVPLHEARGGRRVTDEYYNRSTLRKWDLPPRMSSENSVRATGSRHSSRVHPYDPGGRTAKSDGFIRNFRKRIVSATAPRVSSRRRRNTS